MGHFSRYFFTDKSGETLEHSANKEHAKYGTANSVSEERGTDNKKNNTSEYNHKYYEENTEKWKDNKTSSKKSSKSDNDDLYYDKDGKARFGHKDYDENDEDFKRTDGEKIEGTDLRTFTNKNGSTIIMGKGIKFSFPPGTKITTAMAKKIAAIEKANDGKNKEQYIAKMLNAVTGFADKQKLFPTEKKSSSKKSSSKSSEKRQSSGSSSNSPSSSNRDWGTVKTDYYSGKNSTAKKKTSTELKSDAQTKGKSQTNYYKKKYKSQNYKTTSKSKSVKHYDDLGSVFVRDLF